MRTYMTRSGQVRRLVLASTVFKDGETRNVVLGARGGRKTQALKEAAKKDVTAVAR